ncbi:alkaline phosphatase family protein [Virgibacillus alimentarius]|uniref:AlkP superfamily pyrophosphatase or phosphodiesterase n=1 Tax=Virgibacillus alimentarius TaxID=698769 RepID=A0ABS4SA55_9BACI|nr:MULTISPECIES: alkaline phosphatase family protein [Virgibacillus]MBP2258378.1 putative AlkP superfamily pyrophosphatase or phosphodiesterase [Virgibacillus alimentarius]HLR67636.1 alkaline phosphatase family protein [Virgibacillus sp.]
MSNKLIVVVIDGMRYDLAVENLGYIEHLVDIGKAMSCQIKSELPSLSRPLYEVLLTGTPSSVNGITSNGSIQLSKQESLFHLTKKHGLINATASYYWVSELYHRAPFHFLEDREQRNPENVIQYGKFYWEDHYPDGHLLMDGEVLRQQVNPDFLYIHSMNVDDAGHKYGSNSKEYREKILQVDNYLSELIPIWQAAGYQIVVTADHGMSEWGLHGGTTDVERMVPIYVLSEHVQKGRFDHVIPQLAFAPFMCQLLDIPVSEVMQELPELVTALLAKK